MTWYLSRVRALTLGPALNHCQLKASERINVSDLRCLPVCDLSSSQAGHGLLQVLPQVCDVFDRTQPPRLWVFTWATQKKQAQNDQPAPWDIIHVSGTETDPLLWVFSHLRGPRWRAGCSWWRKRLRLFLLSCSLCLLFPRRLFGIWETQTVRAIKGGILAILNYCAFSGNLIVSKLSQKRDKPD